MQKSVNENNNNISFSPEEEKLFKKYFEEYNELYQKIILLSSNDFMQCLTKRVEISLKEKFNGFSQKAKAVVENFILEKIYNNDYKYALFAKRNILQRNSSEIESHVFYDDIIPHCNKDQKDGFYIHTCGQKFQTFRYKPINHLSIVYKNYNKNEKILLLYCEECDMIYKSDLIKFKCNSTNENFYSKIIDKNTDISHQLATWKKYHCNIIINDSMKCQICNQNLYFLSEVNLLFCQKCNTEFDPTTLMWKCIKCKTDFIAEVKIFNPLEYKNMKICVKETILDRKKARPKHLGCDCNGEVKKMKFFHKNSCNGDLFLGELNNKKVVVCNKCESLGLYEGYVWTCPICYKRFKNKTEKEEEKNNDINKNEDYQKNLIKRFCNNSSSNWNLKINNFDCYKSPMKYDNNRLYLEKKEKEYQSDIKNINISRRNNSALKLIGKERCASGLPSPSKFIDDIYVLPEINQINNIHKINIPKSINKNNIYNQIPNSKNYSNSKRPNRLMSNVDLGEGNNLENIFNKCFAKNEIISYKNYNDNCNNDILFTDVDLGDKVNINNNYKKGIINSYSKKINMPTNRNNSINCEIGRKRSNSNYNSIQINMDDGIPYVKNLYKNNIIIKQNKIPINRINNIKGININGSASTSCDSKGEINPKDNVRKSPVKNPYIYYNNIKNKKIVPGQLNLQNYIIKKQIGQGSFGQIFLVEDFQQKQYALKKIIAGSSSSIKKIKNELQILLDIQNSGQELNVVEIYGMTSSQLDLTTYALYVLMELASTDWEKEILERKKEKKYYTEYELMTILHCLVKSLSILQRQNISHRDIKPQNVLIIKESNSQKIYKLADFGEAKELLKGERPTNKQTLRGTELYMSPILFYALRGRQKMKYVQHNPYKSDVFSFGLCALLAATLGFESLFDIRELKSNISIYVVIEKYLRFKYSDNVINIISRMLDINENTRCDFIQLEREFNNLGYY